MTTNEVQCESLRESRPRLRSLTIALTVGAVLLITAAVARSQEQNAPTSPVYTVLYTFTGGADGANPNNFAAGGAGLTRDQKGNLYGTTSNGGDVNGYCGTYGCGVVFKLDAFGKEIVLHTFTGPPDGVEPGARLVRDSEGSLYGTTMGGGTDISSAGTVFKLDRAGNEIVLYSFTGGADGNTPSAGLIQDDAGNLYGTTVGGGASLCCGVVFKVDSSGNETVLYSFGAQPGFGDGGAPGSPLIRDSMGNLYGTTFGGGAHGSGTVFKLDPITGNETVLYSFTGGADGGQPTAGLVRDDKGNFYGTASAGGSLSGVCGGIGPGCGVLFKLDPVGKLTVLHTFTGGTDGSTPYGGLIRAAGNIYGTTYFGGDFGWGLVFKLDSTGKLTVLHAFTGGADGAGPYVGLIADEAGNLYGTTGYGGNSASINPSCGGIGCGVVFRLSR